MRHLPLLLMLLLAVAACDVIRTDDAEVQYVVESYLIAGEPLDEIRLSRTAPLEGTYDFNALAVQDARVAVELLEEEGDGVADVYAYRESPDSVGVYVPVRNGGVRVRPLRRYRLRAEVPATAGGPATIRATTLVPDTFSVVRANTDEVVYQQEEQLALTVTRSRYPGRQAYYVLSVESLLDPLREAELTPFVARFLEEGTDEDLDLQDLRISSSPVLNEANYEQNADGTLTIELPWLAVAFYGPNRLRANALDDNLYDFVRSLQVQQGGSTLSPGEIPNIIEHIEGGTGIFGSLARRSFDATIRRPPEDDGR